MNWIIAGLIFLWPFLFRCCDAWQKVLQSSTRPDQLAWLSDHENQQQRKKKTANTYGEHKLAICLASNEILPELTFCWIYSIFFAASISRFWFRNKYDVSIFSTHTCLSATQVCWDSLRRNFIFIFRYQFDSVQRSSFLSLSLFLSSA